MWQVRYRSNKTDLLIRTANSYRQAIASAIVVAKQSPALAAGLYITEAGR